MVGDRNDKWTVTDAWSALPPEGGAVNPPWAGLRRRGVLSPTAVVWRVRFLRVGGFVERLRVHVVTNRVSNTLRWRSSSPV